MQTIKYDLVLFKDKYTPNQAIRFARKFDFSDTEAEIVQPPTDRVIGTAGNITLHLNRQCTKIYFTRQVDPFESVEILRDCVDWLNSRSETLNELKTVQELVNEYLNRP